MSYLKILPLLLFTSTAFAQSKDDLLIRDAALLKAELKEMVRADQQYHRNLKKHKAEVFANDERNTTRMIAIINTYGYPSPSRKGFTGNPGAILVHAPYNYADTLQVLLDAEKAAGRILNNDYAFIMWHIHGRYGLPAVDSNSGIKMKDKRKYNPTVTAGRPVIDSMATHK